MAGREGTPILVTGAPRSGTTIVGKLLAAPPEVALVYEPFNAHIGLAVIPYQFVAVTEGSTLEALLVPAVEDLLGGRATFRIPAVPGHEEGRARRLVRRVVVSRTNIRYQVARIDPRRRRWLLKDPLAAFSAEWLHRRFGMATVVVVRHPAAVVASYRRLGWRFSLAELQVQSALMHEHLAPVLAGVDAPSLDAVDEGALLWRSYYTALGTMLDRNPDMIAIRHEDLAGDPVGVLQPVYERLGLRFDRRAGRAIHRLTGAQNPASARAGRVHTLARDSRRVVDAWRDSMTPAEVERITDLAGPPFARWYDPGAEV